MMNISEIIIQLKKHIAMERYVFYQGSRYIPTCLVYWFDRVQNQWNYSVELMDPSRKNTTVRANIEKITFEKENTYGAKTDAKMQGTDLPILPERQVLHDPEAEAKGVQIL